MVLAPVASGEVLSYPCLFDTERFNQQVCRRGQANTDIEAELEMPV